MAKRHRIDSSLMILVLGLTVLMGLAGGVARADSPTVTIVAPSQAMGDFGASQGNVWDMSGANDVTWTQPNSNGQTISYSIPTSGLPADSYGNVLLGSTPTGSDLAMAFYTNGSVSIPSQTHRYLLYRSWIAPHQPGEGGDQVTNGRILYSANWGSNWMVEALPYRRYSKPYTICGYGTWCLYFVDLAQTTVNGPGSYLPWDWGQPGASVEAFGLWVHENWAMPPNAAPSGDSPNYFFLDYVYLVGEIVTSQPPARTYTVRWTAADADRDPITSRLYYQEKNEIVLPAPTCNSGNLAANWINFAVITPPSPPAGPLPYKIYLPLISKSGGGVPSLSYTWSLADDAKYKEGRVYYVCVVAEDSQGNKTYQASSAPVIKVPSFTFLNPINAVPMTTP